MKTQITKKTFIVDDDPFWNAMITQILTNLGYNDIVSFSSGADCINNLDQHPNLIFLDYQMEDMDGLAVLQKIKNYNADIVVVFCTEHKELSLAVSAMKYGAFDYLVKSNAHPEELSSLIKSIESHFVFAEKVF